MNWKDDYFIEELLYSKEENLLNAKDIEMQVQTLNSDLNNKGMCKIKENNGGNEPDQDSIAVDHESGHKAENCLFQNSTCNRFNENYLLDIDLDFFSTHNPFKLHHLEVVKFVKFTHQKPLLMGCSAIHCKYQGSPT